ncbi:lipid-binding SYLF domain-containing protein [Prosthecobacter sp.]|uniref:lipid-binding SYLF domain-containing protein n=1 Tax=Prosthecobacter sp. TaxID=1965333 RepID=UPI003783EBA0
MNKSSIVLITSILTLAASGTALQAGTREDWEVQQANAIMQRFKSMPEKSIPKRVMRDAKGLAILTVTKGGFIWSVKGGHGIVIARNKNGWSGPAFIRTGGVGFGAQVGGEVTEYVLVLNTPEAVRAFSQNANVELGGALSAAAGPVGRAAEAGVMPKAAVYTYSRSQGLFAGASLEGSVITANKKANQNYYHSNITPGQILAGQGGHHSSGPMVTSR